MSDSKIRRPDFDAYFDRHLDDLRSLAAELAELVDVATPTDLEDAEFLGPDRLSVAAKIASVFRTAMPLFESDSAAVDIQLAHSLWTAIERREYHRVVALVGSRLVDLHPRDSIPDRLTSAVRLLSFAASFASAEDDESLREALEALADPVGSFRARRLPDEWSWSLVSYVGGGVGREWITGIDDSTGDYWGAFAPVGIEFSWGTGTAPSASC